MTWGSLAGMPRNRRQCDQVCSEARYPAGAPVPRKERPGTDTILVSPRIVSTHRDPQS
jgi:hypothetical protein